MNERVIRANFDKNTIVVYQAFNSKIAKSAVLTNTFKHPLYNTNRMTWIKPSFLWMMYRSGWGTKNNQEHILEIRIKRDAFIWAIENSCLSHYDENIYQSEQNWKEKLNTYPVRIQWDPERNIFLEKLNYRSIQIGLKDISIQNYINNWIVSIRDITTKIQFMHSKIIENKINEVEKMLPIENIFPLTQEQKNIINHTY